MANEHQVGGESFHVATTVSYSLSRSFLSANFTLDLMFYATLEILV